ncbi:hypothetical protein APF79_03165 [bacterium BRH_c32]|nr:MAG: hypothetical protein APF79_03165 [bacterium BRH_c32]
MKCPNCSDSVLQISERKGVEIDYCPNCRGVWLDRGELDKIIDKSMENTPPPQNEYRQRDDYAGGFDDDNFDRNEGYYRQGNKRKRRGFLGELFDFD